MTWTIHIDGAARGNPGPAAFAYVITRDGHPPVMAKGCLGSTTNNVAEYTALVRALERAAELGADRLLIHSDSELLVKQMNCEYQVKNPDLRVLYNQAKRLAGRFDRVSICHVPRSENRVADRLCNEALDGECSPAHSRSRPAKPPARKPSARDEAVREEAVLCLRAAAKAWAAGNPANPPPEAVWEQLWTILEENGVLRAPRTKT